MKREVYNEKNGILFKKLCPKTDHIYNNYSSQN